MRERALILEEIRRVRPSGTVSGEEPLSTVRGGRKAAEELLAAIRPAAYGSDRNFLDGSVTRLSPYVTHGVVTLAELRDRAFAAVSSVESARKFMSELGWRDYYQRVWALLGDQIWEDLEPYKTGMRATAYHEELPRDIREGQTGLDCVDAMVRELTETGYLHNHARMWLAAYVVHWRRVRWQAGARWFLQHLLDGDEASNNLSWQWVASTFSHKPYIFNRANLERYSRGRWCDGCPVRGSCDFEGTYEELSERLFERTELSMAEARGGGKGRYRVGADLKIEMSGSRETHGVVWIHSRNLNPNSRLMRHCAGLPAVWVWDAGSGLDPDWSMKRWVFVGECLAELPVERMTGEAAEAVRRFAHRCGVRTIWTSATPVPAIRRTIERLRGEFEVRMLEEPPFARLERGADLGRFSRYWRVVEKGVCGGWKHSP
jgi:deoxyribodipyrimidine photo-lyase